MIFDKFLSLLPSELDGALIMSEENRRYFTSFPSSDGVLLISRNGTVFLTDSRYVEAAQKKITVCPVRLTKDLSTELPQLMSEFKINNLAVETTRLTVAQFEEFTKWMPDTGICTENYADRAIDALRMVKSDDEVKLVCEAQAIAERAFDHILEFIKPGVTEREIQLELDYYMLRNGAEALSFETIAVSGVNSSMPHGVPSDKKIENGDFITMDYGAVVGGYHSDMTRTVAVGSVSEEQKKIYNTVLEAQLAAGVILNDGDLIAVDDLHELMTAIQIPGAAGGVLEIGDDVDHLHALGGGQDLLQLLHDHAAVIGGNFDELGLAGLERVDSAQIGGAFQQNHVAGVQEHAGREVQTLLRTGGDEDVILVGVDIVLGQHTLGDLLAQAGEALGGGILQSLAAMLLQDGDRGLHHLLHGEQLRCGHAAGKGNDVGLCGELQQLTDLGPLQKVHPC